MRLSDDNEYAYVVTYYLMFMVNVPMVDCLAAVNSQILCETGNVGYEVKRAFA